ncbi:MAG: AAA family ATPase [Pleurocapsa sp. MO_226.B13]|nr:AAA family ATPase [Pleurocapsa sp. MO_226.B13]
MVKKTFQTESIEVPVAIAREVKLFINLLQTGEIDSLSDLLQQAGYSKPTLFDLTNLDDIWKTVTTLIEPPTTRALLSQQSRLVSLNEDKATIAINSAKLVKLHQSKIPNIEAAMQSALGYEVTVELITGDAVKESSPAIQQDELSNLTGDQQLALSQLKSFTRSQEKFFRLTGYAGTGKSFLMCHYIKWLLSEGITFVAACPTNKAAKSLRNLADEEGLNLDVKTVAQLLGQQPEINEETGKEEFLIKGEADLTGYNIVIVDEFSMVNKENFKEIVTAARSSLLTKVVFVGDAAQLPPVKEKEPIVATSELIERDATLTEVVRYDGQIARVAEVIRSNPKYSRVTYPFTTSSDKTILCVPQTEWLDRAIELFESEEYNLNPDYVRFLAWRNKTVKSLNQFVRTKLWGENAPSYVPGDRLIARKPLFRSKPGGKGKNKWRILINNSEEATVIEAGQLKELIFQKEIYQYWQVEVQPSAGGKPQTLSILHEDFLKRHSDAIKHFADKKQWSYYFDLSRMFDDVGYAYALTTHKAQGSTIDYVFLDVNDMRGCSDRQKLLYTALTRAKQQALISNLS